MPPRWPTGRASASGAAGLGSIPDFAVDLFSSSSLTSDLKIGTPWILLLLCHSLAVIMVSAGTGWPNVSIL